MDQQALWPVEGRKTDFRKLCMLSVVMAFGVGLVVGVLIPVTYVYSGEAREVRNGSAPGEEVLIGGVFLRNSASVARRNLSYDQVRFVESDGIVDGVFWGRRIEDALPRGFGEEDSRLWGSYVQKAEGVKLEPGCGRMQNRLVVFQDGSRGCVRYRQNLDQIQGEIFSFYLARLLNLPNLAPSTVSIVDFSQKTWSKLQSEISQAQWTTSKPVVLTKFIPNLTPSNIPTSFRPPDTQLSHKELLRRNSTSMADYIELAQWSDLVLFDYLTANLDRVVNNLYNKQWNVNIMEAPAHNLARKDDSNLLLFLDNESGLLHGYRLLGKYEPYHSLLLENLCVFRKPTVALLEALHANKNIGQLLNALFERTTTPKIRDVLPGLPPKSVKILNERIERVLHQVERCRRA